MRTMVMAIWILLLPSLCFGQVEGKEDIRQLAVGQRWEYAHTGARPADMSMQPKVIDGKRTFQVIERVEEENNSYWIIEENFTNDPEIVSRLHINDEKLLLAIYNYHVEKGMFLKMTYNPPIPWQTPVLKIGEEKAYESSLILGDGELTLPETVVFKRLPDETIEIEAGTYVNCRRVQVSISCVMDFKLIKIPYQEKRDLWLHPDVKGTVKEAYTKEDIKIVGFTQKGYSCSSVLTSYAIQDKAEAILVNKEILEHDDSGMSLRTKFYLALFGALAVLLLLLVAIILGIRYFWRKARRKRKQTLPEPEKAVP